jgi:predicted TIM-barrel fold metal-dependent hydrolase
MEPLIDIHSHFLPHWYLEAAKAAGHAAPDGMPGWPDWNLDAHLRFMDAHGIGQAVLSLSSPGVHFGDDAAAAELAVRVNDFAAELCAARPDRFRFFAVLPLPAVEEALGELVRALDTLGAVGAVAGSNAHGRYPGTPEFEPIWSALDERAAALFIHPTSPGNWRDTSLGLPRPLMEFLFDTTRAIVDATVTGAFARHPAVRVIVPHTGALLPLLGDRIAMFLRGAHAVPDIARTLAQLWYDLAGTPMPAQAKLLIDKAGTNRILYGSDYCFTPSALVTEQIASLDDGWPAIAAKPWRTLTTHNARTLLDDDQVPTPRKG